MLRFFISQFNENKSVSFSFGKTVVDVILQEESLKNRKKKKQGETTFLNSPALSLSECISSFCCCYTINFAWPLQLKTTKDIGRRREEKRSVIQVQGHSRVEKGKASQPTSRPERPFRPERLASQSWSYFVYSSSTPPGQEAACLQTK